MKRRRKNKSSAVFLSTVNYTIKCNSLTKIGLTRSVLKVLAELLSRSGVRSMYESFCHPKGPLRQTNVRLGEWEASFKKPKKEKIQESYLIMQNEKKSIFASPIQLIIGVLIFASIIVTFAFNGAIYVSVMLGVTLIFTIVSMIFFNNMNKRKFNLEISEKALLNGKDIDINDFVDNTYNVTSMFSLKRFLSIFLSLCGSVLLMIVLKEYELNFVLFYFFMILFALDKLNDVLSYLLNSEEREKLDVRDGLLFKIRDNLLEKYPKAKIDIQINEQYQNMAEFIKNDPRPLFKAIQSIRNVGLDPESALIRGGTDGASFSKMGLVTPNLGTGSANHHGPYEYLVVQDFLKEIDIIVDILTIKEVKKKAEN